MSELQSYSPLNPDVHARINAGWSAYKNTFKLEGELYFLLKNEFTTIEQKEEIRLFLAQRDDLVSALLPIWEEEWLTPKISLK